MTILDVCSEVGSLRAEEEGIASFTGRVIEIAAGAGGRGSGTSPTAALNAMRLPAMALDQHGFVVDVNATADTVFDHNIKIKDRRLFIRDPDARTLLKEAIDQLKDHSHLNSLALEPVIVPRMEKLPVIVRIWPFDGPAHQPGQDVRALLTLNALGPKPGPPAAILAKTFRLTPSEAKARLHHRARRPSRYRRPRIEDFPGDGAQSVEIRVCQDEHTSPKRACRAATASRLTDQISQKSSRTFRHEIILNNNCRNLLYGRQQVASGVSMNQNLKMGVMQGNCISKEREEFDEIILIPGGFFEFSA